MGNDATGEGRFARPDTELMRFSDDRGAPGDGFPLAVDLSPGEELWPTTAVRRSGYAVVVIRVDAFLPQRDSSCGILSPALVSDLAARWAYVRHRPDTLIRTGDAEFCAISELRDRPHHVMDVVDDFRAAAQLPLPSGDGWLRGLLSFRILFIG